jgi:preprotein translocase subunit SecY
MLDGFQNATQIPELRRRVLFTFGMLAVYRVGVAVPTPGIDTAVLGEFFRQQANDLFNLMILMSGGALERFSIFALGIMPYISASIIFQLLTVVVPYLERLSKEGELGRRKITQYTRYGTVVLSLVQSFFISIGLQQIEVGGALVVQAGGLQFQLMTMVTLTAGTAFIMWLGEQITERGVGNGISLIIFAGIVAAIPSAVKGTLDFLRQGELGPLVLLFLLLLMVAVVAFIIFAERGQRRIPVQYAKRVVGRKMYGGQSSYLPLKINTAGVIPPIFASSFLIFPGTIAGFLGPEYPWAQRVAGVLTPGSGLYELIYAAGILGFCYFYTAVVFNPADVADNMKKFGGYIPGIRPGQRTADYIDRVLSRITLGGALYLVAVCLLPSMLIQQFNVPFFFGGTALLIVVGVGMDTVAQMETHLITRSYDGFMKRGRVRGRGGR